MSLSKAQTIDSVSNTPPVHHIALPKSNCTLHRSVRHRDTSPTVTNLNIQSLKSRDVTRKPMESRIVSRLSETCAAEKNNSPRPVSDGTVANCILRIIRFGHRECYAHSPHIMTTYKVLGKQCARHTGSQPPRACHEESQNGRTYTDGSANEDPCPKCEALSPGPRSKAPRPEHRDFCDTRYEPTSSERHRHSPDPYRDRTLEIAARPKLKRGHRYGA